MGLFLDDNGLRYLWQKIKNMFVAKESGKGLSTNDFTAAYKSKLDGIANNANNYSLPTASATTLGGIKVGSGLSIDNGVLNVTGGGLSVIAEGTIEPSSSSWGSGSGVTFDTPAKFVIMDAGVVLPGGHLEVVPDGNGYFASYVDLNSSGTRLTLDYNGSTSYGVSFNYLAIG